MCEAESVRNPGEVAQLHVRRSTSTRARRSTFGALGYPAAAAAICRFAESFGIFDRYSISLESPMGLAVGCFDLAFVIIALLPLLLIVETYDFWSCEVESGRTRVPYTQAVAPARLLLVRGAIRGGLLLGPVAAIVTLLLAMAGGHDPAGCCSSPRLCSLMAPSGSR
jgi:ABC-2 type transport system permease protein